MVPVSHRDRAFRPKTDRRRRNCRRHSNWLTSAQGLRLGVVVGLFGEAEWRPVFACNSRTTAAGSVHVLDDQSRRLPGCLPPKPFAEEAVGGASCILAGQAHAPAKVGRYIGGGSRQPSDYGRPGQKIERLDRRRQPRQGTRNAPNVSLTRRVHPSLPKPKRPPFMVQNDAQASVDAYPVATMTLTFSRHSRSSSSHLLHTVCRSRFRY